jgi:hypothetical protein
MKLTVAFRNLANAPNTSKLITVVQAVSIVGELKCFRIVTTFRNGGVKSSDAAATQFCGIPPFVIRKCKLYYYEPKNMKTHNFMDKCNLKKMPKHSVINPLFSTTNSLFCHSFGKFHFCMALCSQWRSQTISLSMVYLFHTTSTADWQL